MAAPELNVRANAALDDLYRRHVGDVYRYTYAVLGNHADAEDVTQTTFVNALRALERGDEPREPSSWLLAISHNIVRQRWRQAAVRPTEVELAVDVPDESAEPDVELDELVRALQRIPPAQREAIVMRELEGRSYNEISELLGLSISALETLLFRARRSLAEELQNIVTCQSAELAMSKQLDGRLSRKERRRLDEHLAECDACAKLAETQRRQRRAFKGLAVLPIPVGLAIFKGVPTASAATLPTIGLGATGSGTGVGATGVGAGGTGAGAAGAGGATAAAGGTLAGGSILGSAVAKVAAVVIAGTVATGVGYEGLKAVTNDAKPIPARSSDERAVTPSSKAATPATVPATTLSGRRDVGTPFVPSGGSSGSSSSTAGSSIAANPAKQPLDDSPVVPTGSVSDDAGNAAATPDTTPRKNPKSNPPATTPPETTPPVATPTPPETPAGPPASTPPESPGASASTPPATSTGTPLAGSGGSDGQTACPAGGSGPGNGSRCGLARGHQREAPTPAVPSTPAPSTPAPETTPTPQVPTEPGAGAPESAGPSVGESMSDTHAGKSDT
jgi:RNA polymerase sigma factor (sigma-70 family)